MEHGTFRVRIGLLLAGCVLPLVAESSSWLAVQTARADAAGDPILGRQIADFSLRDFRGKLHALSDYRDRQVVIVYFMGTECPLAKIYGPRVREIASGFTAADVTVLAVNSNAQDSLSELASFARLHELEYPILKDLNHKVADLFGASRTPQVFVLDRLRKIRYYGRIDAQFTFGSGVGLAQPQEQRQDLVLAVRQLLGGEPVAVPVTEARGCLIGRAREPQPDSPVTYSRQISRLIQRRCLECHRRGQIAPFAMTEYEEVSGWGEMIAEVVREQRMPPWHANPEHGKFANENRLSEAEKQLIYTWVENGCPRGDPADLPATREFPEDWSLPRNPDLVVALPQVEKIKPVGVENYRYIEVDPGFKEDKWISLAECKPGNRAVVHHIVVYVRPPRQTTDARRRRSANRRGLVFLAGFAPGTRPLTPPEGWAHKVAAGSRFVFQMHYTPIGTAQSDRSSIGLVFADKATITHRVVTTAAANHRFEIPRREANHRVVARKTFRRDTFVFSLFPHMHMRGKSFRYVLIYPGSEKKWEVLLDVPRFDFNWQNAYVLAQPKLIPKGSVLHCTAYFDNSSENLANPDPEQTVRWGDQTWEEMMIGYVHTGIPIAPGEFHHDPGKPPAPDAGE
ncbi:MAG: hypothetical protein CMJ75_18180 [Planctomycetaceae bacterium]|nr:hypothetical protein [Planctomycetaceae bacterium]